MEPRETISRLAQLLVAGLEEEAPFPKWRGLTHESWVWHPLSGPGHWQNDSRLSFSVCWRFQDAFQQAFQQVYRMCQGVLLDLQTAFQNPPSWYPVRPHVMISSSVLWCKMVVFCGIEGQWLWGLRSSTRIFTAIRLADVPTVAWVFFSDGLWIVTSQSQSKTFWAPIWQHNDPSKTGKLHQANAQGDLTRRPWIGVRPCRWVPLSRAFILLHVCLACQPVIALRRQACVQIWKGAFVMRIPPPSWMFKSWRSSKWSEVETLIRSGFKAGALLLKKMGGGGVFQKKISSFRRWIHLGENCLQKGNLSWNCPFGNPFWKGCLWRSRVQTTQPRAAMELRILSLSLV